VDQSSAERSLQVANLSVTVEDIPAGTNLDKYIQNSMEDLNQF
jgi:hypothetical protein